MRNLFLVRLGMIECSEYFAFMARLIISTQDTPMHTFTSGVGATLSLVIGYSIF